MIHSTAQFISEFVVSRVWTMNRCLSVAYDSKRLIFIKYKTEQSIYFLAKNFNGQVHCHAKVTTLILRRNDYQDIIVVICTRISYIHLSIARFRRRIVILTWGQMRKYIGSFVFEFQQWFCNIDKIVGGNNNWGLFNTESKQPK